MMNAWTAQASLGQFGSDFQREIAITVGVVLALYVILIFVSKLRGKGAGQSGAAGKPVFDFERMKRAGLLTDEEYKRVKRKMVEQAADSISRAEAAKPKLSAAEELSLLDAAIETKGIDEALTPEERAEHEAAKARRAAIAAGEETGASQFDKYRDQPADPNDAKILAGPGADASNAQDAVDNPDADTFGALDPLAQQAPTSAEDRLDGMLKAGVITQEEYEKMKGKYQ
jgi:hypothetical protein